MLLKLNWLAPINLALVLLNYLDLCIASFVFKTYFRINFKMINWNLILTMFSVVFLLALATRWFWTTFVIRLYSKIKLTQLQHIINGCLQIKS